MLLGSDVKCLFPSLSKERTAKAVKNQARKIPIQWTNIDTKWLTLYIHLNRELSSDLSKIEHLLPYKRKDKKGVEPGMSSVECMQRHLSDTYEINGKTFKSTWIWPLREPTNGELRELMATFLEIAVKFFFDHFVYKFGGQDILQCFGGPIGARLTMCIARLVMQEWWDNFEEILKRSNIEQKLRAIYVDDGRLVIRKLGIGVRFNKEKMIFEMRNEWAEGRHRK